MRLLFICSEFPSPSNANSYRVLYPLKYLSEKFRHDITLIAFKLQGKDYPDLSTYGRIETINLAVWPGLKSPRVILLALKNIFLGHLSLRNYAYSREMDRKIKALLDNNSFDVLVIDHPSMLTYTSNKGVSTVLMEAVALSEITWMYYKLERNWLIKIIRLLYYYQIRGYAREYRAASVSVAVSEKQRDMVLSHCSDLDIAVIPTGVETDYLGVVEPETEFLCVVSV